MNGRLYLCTRSSAWWRNLRNARTIDVRLRGRRVAATPAVLDVATPEALETLRAFLTANPKTGEMLSQVRSGRDRRPDDDLRREMLRSVVTRLDVA